MKTVLDIILFLVAIVLIVILTPINYLYVDNKKGYFRSTALNLDIWANIEFRTLWNLKLRTPLGYEFGANGETISSALGKNERDKTLTKKGKALVWVLDFLDENHCEKSINELIEKENGKEKL